MSLRLFFIVAVLALSACGTKGPLECPPGTEPRIDGTCQAPAE